MSTRVLVVASLLLASLASGLALRMGDYGTAPWMLSRGSGLVAFGLLSLSMVMGLLISTKAADGTLSRPFVFTIHQFVSVLSLAFMAVHGGALLFDGFLRFGPLALLVPFAAPYRPFWVGLGVIAAWSAAAVTASFWFRKRIGQRNWRRLHYASFGAYVLALGHGVFSGTDTSLPLVAGMYVISFAAVAGLLTYRIGVASRKARPAPAGAARRSGMTSAARPRSR